jgi:hypothetical protein
MPKIDRLSRRTLLRALGLGPAVLPMLAIEREAHGQAPAAKAGLILAWTNGWLSQTSATGWPGPGTDWTFKPFQAALEPHKADLLLLDGINYRFVRDGVAPERTGHAAFPGMLTGQTYQTAGSSTANIVAGGPSIDQHIGSSLVKAGYAGLPTLNLGVFVKSTGRLSWRAAGDPVIPATDPYKVFTQVFGASMPAPGGGTMPDPAAERKRAIKKSILDHVVTDLNRFSSRVGTEDKAAIEAHLESIRTLENELDRQMMPTTGGKPPVLEQGVEHGSTNAFETTTKMMIDISVAALAADATRMIVLQLGDQGDANLIFTKLGFQAAGMGDNTGDNNGFHNIAHANGADKDKCDTWFQEQLAYTIASMKAVGLLDRGVLLAMNSMRHGMHEFANVPALIAGNAGGYFATGRSIVLPNNPAPNGILIALANALGVPTETFGRAEYGGELSVLRG